MAYLYSPPSWRNVAKFPGARALRFGITTSTVVYRQGGVWTNIQTAGMDQPVVSSCDTDPSGLLLFFDRPTVVPNSLFTELSALAPADSSWTPGTLTPV